MRAKNYIIDLAYRAIEEQWDLERLIEKTRDLPPAEFLKQEIIDALQEIKTRDHPPQVIKCVLEVSSFFSTTFFEDMQTVWEMQARIRQAIAPEILGDIDVVELAKEQQNFFLSVEPLMQLVHEVEGERLSLTQALEKAREPDLAASIREDMLPQLRNEISQLTRTNSQAAYIFACLVEAVASHNRFTLEEQVGCTLLLGQLGCHHGDPQFVLERQKRALALCQKEGILAGEALIHLGIGNIHYAQRRFAQAEECCHQALKIFTDYRDSQGKARALLALGNIAFARTKNEQAEEFCRQALPLFREEEDSDGQTEALHALGQILLFRGNYAEADECFNQALALSAHSTDAKGRFHLHLSRGALYKALGLLDQAISYCEKALTFSLGAEGKSERVDVLLAIGEIRLLQDQRDLAREALDQALDLCDGEDAITIMKRAHTLLVQGELFLSERKRERAWSNFTEALKLLTDVDDKRGQIGALLNLGGMQIQDGRYQDALPVYQRVLNLCREAKDRPGEARALLAFGNIQLVLSARSQLPQTEALSHSEQALKLFQEAGDQLGAIEAYATIGNVQWKSGNLSQAQRALQNALAIFENIRDRQQRENTRRNLSGRAAVLYAMIVEICLAQGLFEEAWHWAERSKGRALLDLLRRRETDDQEPLRPRMNPGQKMWYERWQQQADQVISLERELHHLANRAGESWTDTEENSDVAFLREALARARQEELRLRQQVTDMLEEGRELIQVEVPAPKELARSLHALARPQGAKNDLTRRPLVVEYFLLDDDRYAVFLLPLWEIQEGQQTLPLTAHVISSLPEGTLPTIFQKFDEMIVSARRGFRGQDRAGSISETPPHNKEEEKAAQDATLAAFATLPVQLYQAFIQPWSEALDRLAPNSLIIVPHGPLHQLPLHTALFPEGQALIDRYPLVYLSSATLAATLEKRRQKNLQPQDRLVMGPPEEDLRAAQVETNELADNWGLKQKEQPYQFERMKIAELRKRARGLQLAHLATHSVFNHEDYLRSYIKFSEERLTLFDLLRDPQLDFHGMRLFYLSSCESGRAYLNAADELQGLIWALMYAGTNTVMASLWPVHDLAGLEMAEHFYDHWKPGVSPMSAYQEAMQGVRSKEHPKIPFSNPYFWAPFILVGDGFSLL